MIFRSKVPIREVQPGGGCGGGILLRWAVKCLWHQLRRSMCVCSHDWTLIVPHNVTSSASRSACGGHVDEWPRQQVFYCSRKRDCAFTILSLLKLLAKFNPHKEYFPIKYLLNLRHSLNSNSKYLIFMPVFIKNEFIFYSYHSLGSHWPLPPSALPTGSDRCHCSPNTSSGSSAYSWAWGFCSIWTFSFLMKGSSDFQVHTMACPELLLTDCSRPQQEFACCGSS